MRTISGRAIEYYGTEGERDAFVPRRRGRVHRWRTPDGRVYEWSGLAWYRVGRPLGLDGAGLSIEPDHQAQHDGRAWRVEYEAALVGATAALLHLRTGSREAHLVAPELNAEASDTRLDLWRGQSVQLASEPQTHPVSNYRVGNGPEYGGALYTNSAVALDTAPDKRVLLVWQFGAEGGGPVAASGGVGGARWGPILEPDSDYVIRLQRPDKTGTARGVVAFELVEDSP